MSDVSKVLEKARKEEEARRKASYDELIKLEQIVKGKGIKAEKVAIVIRETLENDIKKTNELNEALKSFSPHSALKSNKLTEIFKCTKKIINTAFEETIEGNLLAKYPIDRNSKTILYGTKDTNGDTVNYSGTSQPNCIQNTYLLVLRALGEINSIQDMRKLQQKKVYNVDTSPNIQTTKFPNSFDSSPYKSWFYFYQDEKSPKQGELLVPHLGYAFGGARADLRYSDKKFKAEDCSSAVAKWLGTTKPFTTLDMKAVHDKDPNCDSDSYCSAAKEALTPVPDKSTGHIFFFPGHTGVVSNIYPVEQLIETLSYSREMPLVEGLGYKNYSYTEKAFLFFQEKILVSDDQKLSHDEL